VARVGFDNAVTVPAQDWQSVGDGPRGRASHAGMSREAMRTRVGFHARDARPVPPCCEGASLEAAVTAILAALPAIDPA